MKNRERKLPAGMTVEASYVMTMVILALAFLIRTAYGRYRRATEVMHLHHVEEQLRYREEEEERVLPDGQAVRSSGRVEGYVRQDDWEKEITMKVHEPEELLRKLTIWRQGGGQEK